ncbi:MAG: HlyD family type I secretion periplasmic adaptor subunit [Pseudomonadota bacterium]
MTAQTTVDDSSSFRRLERARRNIRHLARPALVEEAEGSAVARYTVVIVAALVVGFILWANFMEVEEVAVTSGAVVPSKSIQVIQHLEGGIVREILVDDRAMVEAGQVLMRLDPLQAQSEHEQARSRRAALIMKAERLRAFAEWREPDFSALEKDFPSLAADQREIQRANLDRWTSQRMVIEEQIAQKREELRAVRDQQKAVREQLAMLTEEARMREDLYSRGHVSKVEWFNTRRQRAGVESELHRLEGQENTTLRALDELDKRITDLDSNQRQDALNELGVVTTELAQLEETMARLADRVRRLDVTAPVRGIVQNLKVKTVGAVVPAGGAVMEIVPMDDELLVETRISTRDIGHLTPGQEVIVKVASYDFVRYGSVDGRLRSISATTYIDDRDGTPYYKGIVGLAKPYVGGRPNENQIMPGMTVQADIITGEKTLLQYLLKPIHASMAQAFREK